MKQDRVLDWATCANAEAMLKTAGGVRKIRLAGVAFCRTIWGRLDEEARAAVLEAERYADGLTTLWRLILACRAVEKRIFGEHQARTAAYCAAWHFSPSNYEGAGRAAAHVKAATDGLDAGEDCPAPADIVRDIFPVGREKGLAVTAEAKAVAHTLYWDADGPLCPVALNVLADALEEAGNPEWVTGPLRRGVHYRGQWVVDAVLGMPD